MSMLRPDQLPAAWRRMAAADGLPKLHRQGLRQAADDLAAAFADEAAGVMPYCWACEGDLIMDRGEAEESADGGGEVVTLWTRPAPTAAALIALAARVEALQVSGIDPGGPQRRAAIVRDLRALASGVSHG